MAPNKSNLHAPNPELLSGRYAKLTEEQAARQTTYLGEAVLNYLKAQEPSVYQSLAAKGELRRYVLSLQDQIKEQMLAAMDQGARHAEALELALANLPRFSEPEPNEYNDEEVPRESVPEENRIEL